MLFAIHDRMIHALEYLLRIDFFILIPYDWLEEAGRIAGMTCRTYLIDFCKQGILVTVDGQGFDILKMSGCLAFCPETLSAPAEIGHPSSFHRFFKCLLIHVCHHQHFGRLIMLGDNRKQSIGI